MSKTLACETGGGGRRRKRKKRKKKKKWKKSPRAKVNWNLDGLGARKIIDVGLIGIFS